MASAADQLELWIAHDHPERPLAYGAWLCCCKLCAFALRATAQARPGMPIVLKTGMDRFVVPAAVAVAARWQGSFERLLRVPDDWIREVFIGPGTEIEHVRRARLRSSTPLLCVHCADAGAGDDGE